MVVKLESVENLKIAVNEGSMKAEDLFAAQEAWEKREAKRRQYLFDGKQNFCKRCGQAFPQAVAFIKACNGQFHDPQFDWKRQTPKSD